MCTFVYVAKPNRGGATGVSAWQDFLHYVSWCGQLGWALGKACPAGGHFMLLRYAHANGIVRLKWALDVVTVLVV